MNKLHLPAWANLVGAPALRQVAPAFHPHGEACGAGGAFYDVLARNSCQSQGRAAMGTFAEDVGLTAPDTGKKPSCGEREPKEEAAERGVLSPTAHRVA